MNVTFFDMGVQIYLHGSQARCQAAERSHAAALAGMAVRVESVYVCTVDGDDGDGGVIIDIKMKMKISKLGNLINDCIGSWFAPVVGEPLCTLAAALQQLQS